MKPLLKWVGGKSQLLPIILEKIPPDFNTYLEPFLGGGAVALALEPKKAVLSDYNQELINVYQAIQNSPNELLKELKKFKNDKQFFLDVRSWDRTIGYTRRPSYRRAARFIFLNKTSFNGLYRVNQKGQCNSPFGYYKNPTICNAQLISSLSNYFSNNEVELKACDFEETLKVAKEGDFVYLDPPYIPISATASFTNYTQVGFGYAEQVRLRNACNALSDKGVKFLLSNSFCDLTLDLYKDFEIDVVDVKRNISCKAETRTYIKEILVKNY